MQEYELIIDALDWKVIYHNEAGEYMLIDKNTNEYYYLDCIAQLTYSINATPTDDFDTLFQANMLTHYLTTIVVEKKYLTTTLHFIGLRRNPLQ